MKINRLTIVLVLVLTFTLTCFWWQRELKFAEKEKNITSAIPEVVRDDAKKSQSNNAGASEIEKAAAEQNQKFNKMLGITPEMTPEQVRQKALDWYRMQASRLVPEQKPINFFGKVVDENTNAVVAASIHFIWRDASAKNGNSEADTTSSSDGSFSLTDVTGSGISVYVSKDGYYEAKSQNRIDYDPTGNGSTKENPVLFHFRQKGPGVDLITSRHGMQSYLRVSAPRDGTAKRKGGNRGKEAQGGGNTMTYDDYCKLFKRGA